MKIKSKTMLGVSLFAMTFSFSATAQTCKPVPTCAELGYTETSCSGDSIKCPFDTSKMYCVPYPCHSSKTQVGDIYYDDDTCSHNPIKSKTPIGVVYDTERKLVIGLDSVSKRWTSSSGKYADIPELINMETPSNAKNDYNGKSNTDIIIAYSASSGIRHEAAQYCHDKTTGGKTWYLPALGEMQMMITNYEVVETSLNFINSGVKGSAIWTSTERGDYYAYNLTPRLGENTYTSKYPEKFTRCIFSYE